MQYYLSSNSIQSSRRGVGKLFYKGPDSKNVQLCRLHKSLSLVICLLALFPFKSVKTTT